MIADAIYILCTLTSTLCAALLFRAYLRSRVRLLLWSSFCFVGLTVNNVMLFIDKVIYINIPTPGLVTGRSIAALVGVSMLIFGLIWDTE